MIKDILLQVSRSYNPYVPQRELWGTGQAFHGQLNNDFNAFKFVKVDTNNNWKLIDQTYNSYTSIAIKTDGTLWTWGANTEGQLGQNNTVNRSSPVQLGTLTWVSASAGNTYFHAIRSDGTLWGWGANTSYTLGNNEAINRSSPVQIGTRTWKNIYNGNNFSMAVRSDDTLWGWGGSSTYPQLGNGEGAFSFGIVDYAPGPWKEIAPRRSYTIGIKTDGTLWGWGRGTEGQLGTSMDRSRPVQIDTQIYTDAKIDQSSVILRKNDGTIWVYGDNSYGQLGLNDLVNRSSPVQVGTRSWNMIANGYLHMLAIRNDGTLWAWGRNTTVFGQNAGVLGDNTIIDKSSPIQIGTRNDWSYIDASPSGNSFAIRNDGTLWAWGRNSVYGQLGLNDMVDRSSPVQVGTETNWLQIVASYEHTHALKTNGTLWSWGANTEGQLGINSTTSTSSPVQVGTNTNWKSIATDGGSTGGYSQTMAIRTDGTLWKWGSNLQGEMGIGISGTAGRRSSPVQIGTETNWASSVVGSYSALAIRTDGTLWAWGSNTSGQLGLGQGSSGSYSSPVQIGTETNWVSGSYGEQNGVLLKTNGYAYSIGRDSLGYNVTLLGSINRSSPVQIGYENTWVSASNYNESSIAVRTDGTLWVWGDNSSGKLGIGDTINRSSPVQIGTETNWLDAKIGNQHTLALKTNGTIWSWGGTQILGVYSGILGANSFELREMDSGTSWVSASFWGNDRNVTTLKTDGSLWLWGPNTSGQLGFNDTVNRSSPVQLGTLTWKKISNIILNTTLAIRNDNTLWSWGNNNVGQLGLGLVTSTTRSSPVQVGTLANWDSVYGGYAHALAIRSDGTLWAWGFNGNGQLGQGHSIDRNSPVQVGTRTDWANAYAGGRSSFAIRTDGTLWAWGQNNNGQLGTNSTTGLSSPVQIGTRTWNNAYITDLSVLAVRSDGTLWAWGLNQSGELGDGTKINRSSPVQIGTETNWNYAIPAQQNGQSVALKTDDTLWAWGRVLVKDNIDTGPGITSPVQIGIGINWQSITNSGDGSSPMYVITKSNKMYTGPGVNPLYSIWSANTQRSSPVQIGTDTNWAKIGVSITNSFAIKNDSTLWGWGLSNYGFPHINLSYNYTDSPVQIGTRTWKNFSSGYYVYAGITNDDILWSWGFNAFGDIGDLTQIAKSSPIQIGTRLWKNVSHGTSYTMAIRSDDTLWAWGGNSFGQLGLGNQVNRSSPVQVGTETNWYSITGGDTHTAGIKTAWDYDIYTTGGGTLAATRDFINGWSYPRKSPILLSQSNPWKKISPSTSHTMAIKTDGTIWGWGINTSGQLGLNDAINRSNQTQIGTDSDWYDISAGGLSSMALKTNGTLWSWGNNNTGQLGLNDATNRSNPVQVGTRTWNSILSTDNNAMLGIQSNGTFWAWGSQGVGLNIPVSPSRSSPVQIGTDTDWLSMENGKNSGAWPSFAIKNNNSLYVWNGNTVEFGNTTISYKRSSPIQVTSTNKWRNVFAGRQMTFAISTSGSLWFWGDNSALYSGIPTLSASYQESPVQIGTRIDWVSGSSTNSHTMAIRSDGTLWGWGSNFQGRLGSNESISLHSSPVQIGTLTWNKVSTGASHTIAIRNDNTLWSWGSNLSGQLGLNLATSANRSSPVQVGTETNWYDISAGLDTTFAIRTDGTLWGWGLNNLGQLGRNNVTSQSSPVQIGTDTNWLKAVAGSSHTMAIKNNGSLWVWGNNNSGQLGTLRNRSFPNYVVGIDKFTDATAAYQSVIARKSNGTLWSWGANTTYGQLGLGDVVNRSSPVQIGTLSWSMFSNGGFHASAIRNGQLWIWGDNSNAQLGLTQYNPQYISGSNTWTGIHAGTSNIILKKNDNTLWGLGGNNVGQLGLGDVVNRISPVQIGTRTWNDYSTGQSHTLAVASDGTLWGWGINTSAQLGLTKSRSNPNYVDSTQTWTSVKAGYTFSTAIGTDGTIWAWGNNNSGQLGFNDTVTRLSPVRLGTETNWSKHDSTDTTTIAIKTDGTLWGWGAGSSGILGLNDTNPRSSPVQIGTLNNWSQIYVGTTAASIKTDGTLWTWGNNFSGGLGTNESSGLSRSSPIQVGTRTWTQIPDTSGNVAAHVIAIRSDGTLWGWGRNTTGELGQITFATNRSSPVQIGTETNWAYVAVGDINSMAIRSDGTLWSWGSNQFGQLGLNLATTANRSSPVQVGTLADWRSVSLGNYTAFANRTDGTMWAWGRNTNGELGLGDIVNRSSPVQIGTGTNWISGSLSDGHSILLENTGYALTTGVGFGQFTPSGFDTNFMVNRSSPVQIGTRLWSSANASSYSLAIRTDGTLWAWGVQSSGQLGLGDTVTRSSPVQIGTLNDWSKIYTNSDTSYAIKTNGTLWSWGNNSNGSLGLNLAETANRSSPVQVGTDTNWASLADGGSSASSLHILAIKTNGTLWSWGWNTAGQLGLNSVGINRSSPVQVGTRADWVSTTVNSNGSMAIRSDGTLWAWGRSTPNSQLGFDTNIDRSSPVQVGTLATWTSASLGTNFSVLLQNNGDAYTTGLNITDYQPSSINRSSPVQLGTLSNWSYVDFGYVSSLAIKNDGTLWSWGRNAEGQLGLNDNVTRSSPVQVGTRSWNYVYSGYLTSYAISSDGTLWAWGFNNNGQLGDFTSANKSSPVQIGTRTWTSVSKKDGFENSHTMAIRSDGTLWAWGSNLNGELGLFDTVNRSSPVQVGTRTDWVYAAVGDTTSMAIRSDRTLWAWGLNSSAELGLGNVVSRSSPVQVGTPSSTWASASLGDANAVFLQTDGSVLTTGIYAIGFDTNFTVNRSSPVQIDAGINWVDVSTSNTNSTFTFARKSDGTLWAWGNNTSGELGDNSLISKSSPVQVGNDTSWVDISVGWQHSIGIKQY
jgi:alpha-tubulin suppressor-like RCC1 family protein